MASTASASSPASPIPLICFGAHRELALKLEKSLSPHVHYAAIITDFANFEVLTTLLNTLNPTPKGVIIGGGMNDDGANEVRRIVAGWNKGRDEEVDIPVMRVPVGTFQAGGPESLVKWIRDELGRVYGVEW